MKLNGAIPGNEFITQVTGALSISLSFEALSLVNVEKKNALIAVCLRSAKIVFFGSRVSLPASLARSECFFLDRTPEP